ncbi:MAG: YbaN family protein [Gammaproteobacteria bacterium]|nr:YbaN family protein [Gammaproteobacteria bacterium]
MRAIIKHYLLLTTGWLFVILGVIGAFVPLLPTTPFLIVALACFANSSPRFHSMLLNNKWFGPPLAQWERSHTIRRTVKFKVMALIIATFVISILVLSGRVGLQLMLVCLCLILLTFVWRLKESEDK